MTDPDYKGHTDLAPVLEVSGIVKNFGGVVALNRVSFTMQTGAILGIIGPNGAGKTTLFNVISGFQRADSGRVRFKNADITNKPAHEVAKHGLARTFQLPRLFDGLTVFDNVAVGCHLLKKPRLFRAVFGGRGVMHDGERVRARVLETLDLVGLLELQSTVCAELSHGGKRLLSAAIAIAAKPQLLLFDEPLSGLTDEEIARMLAICRRINREGVGVLVVEHNVAAVMGLCDRVIVVNFGEKLAEGTPQEVQQDPAVIEAYLGTPENG